MCFKIQLFFFFLNLYNFVELSKSALLNEEKKLYLKVQKQTQQTYL